MSDKIITNMDSFPVTITFGELHALQERQISDYQIEKLRWLRYLEMAGVDNWEGCGIAADHMYKDYPEMDEEED